MKQISTEDLLRILEENKNKLKEPRQHVNDIHKFIEDLDIKDGKCSVPSAQVYKAYVLWGGKRNRVGFFKLFSQHFLHHRSSMGIRHYNLNFRAIQLLNKVDKGLIKI